MVGKNYSPQYLTNNTRKETVLRVHFNEELSDIYGYLHNINYFRAIDQRLKISWILTFFKVTIFSVENSNPLKLLIHDISNVHQFSVTKCHCHTLSIMKLKLKK